MNIFHSGDSRRLSDILIGSSSRLNNFDFIRFISAFLVIISHSFPLSYGNNNNEPIHSLTNTETMGSLAVYIFFIVSGFLNTISSEKSEGTKVFILKRMLRIYPVLFCVIFLTVFLLGPLYTRLSLIEYFSNTMTYKYLISASAIFIQFNLPGVFDNNPFPTAINGSLWFIKYMVLCYIFTAVLNALRLVRWWSVLIYIAGSAGIVLAISILKIPLTGITYNVYYFTKLSIFFGTGMLFFLFKNFIIFDVRLFIMSLIIIIISSLTPFFLICFAIFIPYCIFFFAYSSFGKLSNFGRHGDFSYGLYIYAFPFQQIISHSFPEYRIWWFNVIVSAPIILIAAIISWNLVEKRMIALKSKI
jgi:peptidoglycan/LPS O-acetylase OafA/YrhL